MDSDQEVFPPSYWWHDVYLFEGMEMSPDGAD